MSDGPDFAGTPAALPWQAGHRRFELGDLDVLAVGVGEELVAGADTHRHHADLGEVIAAARTTILEQFEVAAHTIIVLKAGKLPKTSSGKVQRSLARQRYLNGEVSTIAENTLPTTPSNTYIIATVRRLTWS